MKFDQLKSALSDVGETLRRLFQDPAVHALPLTVEPPEGRSMEAFEGKVGRADWCLAVRTHQAPLPFVGQERQWDALKVTLRAEKAWEDWQASASACQMPTFLAGGPRQCVVPSLPKKAVVQSPLWKGWTLRTQQGGMMLPKAILHTATIGVTRPKSHGELDLALSFPVPFRGTPWQSVPKALWMRYSLSLVKSTGENIRNLEILGIFYVPAKGIDKMRFDAKKAMLYLSLLPVATVSRKVPLVLARHREEGRLLNCFPEEA